MEDFGGELVGGEAVVLEIGRGVDKNFVDGIDVDVFGGDVTEVDVVDTGTVANVKGHAGAGDDKFVFGFLLDFVKAGATRDALSFEGWRNGETDGFVGAGFVGDDKFGLEGVEAAFHAFHGGVERFEVDGDVGPFHRYIIAKCCAWLL